MASITYWSVCVALAGLLFGFDIAVISGVDQPLQQYWQSSSVFHGIFIMSSALWGTVLGALLGSYPSDLLGRKPTLLTIGILFLISALGCALATDPYWFAAMRFLGGLSVGASSIAVPAYISEIARPANRGKLVGLYQFQLVVGIALAYCTNYLLSGLGEHAWRWMLGVEVVPALLYLFLIRNAPESPRWLLLFGRNAVQARKVLGDLDYPKVDEAISAMVLDYRDGGEQGGLFSAGFRRSVLLVMLLAFFNQMSGINFVMYFSPRIFTLAGLDSSSALLSTVCIGVINLVFTLLGMELIDRAGRKTLLIGGSIGYIISLAGVAFAFYAQLPGVVVVGFILLFIASHAVGQGAVLWVFIAEIFPTRIRARGQAFGCSVHWILAAVISMSMLWFLDKVPAYILFGFFAGMMFLQLFYAVFILPETRGRALENISSGARVRWQAPESQGL